MTQYVTHACPLCGNVHLPSADGDAAQLLAALDRAEAVVVALERIEKATNTLDATPALAAVYWVARDALKTYRRAYEDADKVAALADVAGEEQP